MLAEIRNLTNGLGVNVSFEVTGVEVVLRQAIESTSFEGQTVIVSVWEKDATITPNNLVLKEKSYWYFRIPSHLIRPLLN